MADYVPITDTEIDPESPVTTSLWSRVRDNAIAIAEGALGAPRVNPSLFHVRQELSAGTHGGDFNSGSWVTRVLNTIKTNLISGASLASNQITLPAGQYQILASAPAFSTNQHRAKLFNVTDNADVLYSQNAHTSNGGTGTSHAIIRGRFTIAAAKVFEIRHRCQTSVNINGLGYGDVGSVGGFALPEVFTEVEIIKVA